MEIMNTPATPAPRPPASQQSIFKGSLWMVGITLVLFFLPLVNGLIGGMVGGYKVGTVKRALTSAILPAAIVALGLWAMLALLDMPVLGFVAGAAIAVVILLSDLGLLIGAAIGGRMAEQP